MAYIANTAFEVKVSNHEFDSVANITGVFQNGSDTDEICSAGFLCVKDVLTANEGYEKVGPEEDVTINNGNTWTMKAAASSTTVQTPIYACNTFNVNQITDSATGAVYKVGGNTLGLAVPAGERSTFTKIEFDGNHIYRFGAGNVSGEAIKKEVPLCSESLPIHPQIFRLTICSRSRSPSSPTPSRAARESSPAWIWQPLTQKIFTHKCAAA